MISRTTPLQPSLEDLGTPLHEVSFCVVDLETTGATRDDTITEIGAVKVRGGEVLGEFGTLVNPLAHIPATIQVLTGITDQMVARAPTLDQVLPGFLEFAKGCVVVAHNARFDVGFLRRSCELLDYPWDNPVVVDTVALARQALMRDEVPNVKLRTLATHFHTSVEPNHRALSDARATVDVLHGLLERVGNLGVTTLEDLKEFEHRVSAQRRAKRIWAKDLPNQPGVYTFYAQHSDQPRQVLYVGKSVDIARRVRSYFTSSETRPRMDEMVRVATGVEAIVCATDLEAEVRELRMIAAHSPRYNRRSRRQEKVVWVKLTTDAWPRLSITSKVSADTAHYWGPFTSRGQAQEACQVIHDAYPIRQCTQRITRSSSPAGCALAELGRCEAPCLPGADAARYAELVSAIQEAWDLDVRPTLGLVGGHLSTLIEQQRFEQAQQITGRLEIFTNATRRWHQLVGVGRCPQIIAARPSTVPHRPGWQINVIRHGRLAGAGFAPAGTSVLSTAEDVAAVSETVLPGPHDLPRASAEEAERVIAFLSSEGVRLLDVQGDWSMPLWSGVPAVDLPRWTLRTPVSLHRTIRASTRPKDCSAAS